MPINTKTTSYAQQLTAPAVKTHAFHHLRLQLLATWSLVFTTARPITLKTNLVSIFFTLLLVGNSYGQQSPAPTLEQLIPPETQQKSGLQKLTANERELLRQAIIQRMVESFQMGVGKTQQNTALAPNLAAPRGVAPAVGIYINVGGGHWVKENIDRGSMFLLEDGSIWEVQRLDRLDSSLWLRTTSITVVESSDGMPGYNYLLINSDDGEKVHAKYVGKK